MADRVYTDGFPDLWSMVHRDDCTLLVKRGDMGFLVVPSQAVCMAPKLMQGEAWLETAKEIAHALAGSRESELNRIFDEFCDDCGIGPPYEDNEQPRPNVRALRSWKCDRCDHTNTRPKVKASQSPETNMLGWQTRRPQDFLDQYPNASEFVMVIHETEREARIAGVPTRDMVNGDFPPERLAAVIIRPVYAFVTPSPQSRERG